MSVERTVKIDEELLQQLKKLVEDFPVPLMRSFREKYMEDGESIKKISIQKKNLDFAYCYEQDFKTYEKNQEILKKVMNANMEFFRTDNIDNKPNYGTILTVHPDVNAQRLLRKAADLQHEFLKEVMGNSR